MHVRFHCLITDNLPFSINSIIYRYFNNFTSFYFLQSVKRHFIIKSIYKNKILHERHFKLHV